MRVTAIQAKTERKRQDKSARCAEKHRRRAGMLRVYGPIRPTSGVCATTDAARGGKRLTSWRSQAIFTSEGRPLGECRIMLAVVEVRRAYDPSTQRFIGIIKLKNPCGQHFRSLNRLLSLLAEL